jgi:predicted SnoaL-like aldol condensation-catalyzing enzyme
MRRRTLTSHTGFARLLKVTTLGRSTLLVAATALTLAAYGSTTMAMAGAGKNSGAGGPVPVVGAPDPLSLLQDDDPALAANKRLVFDLWRGIVNAGHVELADKLLTEGYIQHSPVLPTGREAFKKIFSAVPRRDKIPELVEPPLVSIIAEGDRVVMTLLETVPNPDGSGDYTSTHFNMFRIENGRLAEHWHSVQTPPGPNVLSPEEGGPQRVTGVTGAAQYAMVEDADPRLAANKRLVFNMWRDIIDAGHEEMADLYMDKAYIEHDPTAATGRDAFKARFAARQDRPIKTSIQTPVVAIVAEGDLVAVVTMIEHPHPSRPGKTYTTTWFDMYRIAEGRIAEHWNPALKAGSKLKY